MTSTALEVVPSAPCGSTPTTSSPAAPNVIVDGSPTDGTVLTVTHWPGYPPPEVVAADTSGEMAFRLLEHRDLLAGAELVSNNHFDQDGLVSIHALVAPDAALARRPFLEDVARAGDFAVYRDRDAARVSMVLSAWADGRGGVDLPADYAEQTALLYGEWAPRLSELCDDIDAPPRPVGGRGRDAHGERGGDRRRRRHDRRATRRRPRRRRRPGRRPGRRRAPLRR